MEAAYRTTELQLFGNIVATDTSWISMPNYTSISSGLRYEYTDPNDSVSKVDSSSAGGQKVGPNLLLKVMSGDTVNFTVQSYYVSPGGGTTNYSSFSDVLTSLSNGLVNLTAGAHGTFSNFTQNGSSVYNGLTSFLGRDSVHSGYPKAYVNWIFLDDQFNYDSALSGAVPAANSNNPAGTLNPVAPGGPIVLNRSGYLYIWVSNETSGWDVYYDNLSVQYKQGPLLEENHYYPFGLTMAGISDKAIKTNYAENKYRYDAGAELQNKEFSDGKGLEIYETSFRGFDPQLGRFAQIDPLSETTHYFSAYEFANNNPISGNDPTGLFAQYQNAPGFLPTSLYNQSNNFGIPTIDQINQMAHINNNVGADAGSGAGDGSTGGGGNGGTTLYGSAAQSFMRDLELGSDEDDIDIDILEQLATYEQKDHKEIVVNGINNNNVSSPLVVIDNDYISKIINTKVPVIFDPIVFDLTGKVGDDIMINLGADVAYAFGAGVGLELNLILTGPNAGSVGLYRYHDYDGGIMASIGISVGFVNFNSSSGKTLSLQTFVGWSQGFMASIGAGGIQEVVSYNTSTGLGIPWLSTVLYKGILVGYGKGGEGGVGFLSSSILLNSW
jgi:RHS repeat-associated protein